MMYLKTYLNTISERGNVGLADIADDLTLTDIHLVAVIGNHGVAGHDAQIALILDNGKGSQGLQSLNVIVVGKILNAIHSQFPFQNSYIM